jgi:hypothetical protein
VVRRKKDQPEPGTRDSIETTAHEVVSIDKARTIARKANPGILNNTTTQQEKALKGLALRQGGSSWVVVARECKYRSAHEAKEAISPIIDMIVLETAREIRAVNFSRLEYMLSLLWPDVESGDRGAMGLALQIIDRVEKQINDVALAPKAEDAAAIESDAVLIIGESSEAYIAAMKKMAQRSS